ncbi:MAG: DUF1326 domain-containing protein [Acidobacteria bacterium]|nr:DUF1326 domain-containing protein [Acidobacteriota bacterium]
MRNQLSRRRFLQTAAVASGATIVAFDPRARSWILKGQTGSAAAQQGKAAGPEWEFDATVIEACSCTMFCPCYFSTVPTGHGHQSMVEHFCRFNMGYKVNRGNFGNVKLDGVKFWIAGDLGSDFAKGAEWAEITFEPLVTKQQRDAITTIVPHVYPVTWKSFTVGKDAPIEWKATKDHAEARLDGGKAAEVILRRNPGMTDEPVVIRNLRYFGAPRNTGFVLMPNEVEAYRVGKKPFEFKGTNGFMITYDITSKDVKK